MNRFYYLAALLFLFGCSNQEANKQRPNGPKESRYVKLLFSYKEISFDTLKVYSSYEIENNSYEFEGVLLDSSFIHIFPKKLSEDFSADLGFFACYKFRIDSFRTGLITRTPSIYESSSIKLLIFDNPLDSITGYVELAEVFGDAGETNERISWLFFNDQKKMEAFSRFDETYDHSVDEPADTVIEHTTEYSVIDFFQNNINKVILNDQEARLKFPHFLIRDNKN